MAKNVTHPQPPRDDIKHWMRQLTSFSPSRTRALPKKGNSLPSAVIKNMDVTPTHTSEVTSNTEYRIKTRRSERQHCWHVIGEHKWHSNKWNRHSNVAHSWANSSLQLNVSGIGVCVSRNSHEHLSPESLK